jgi:hypothetical protein
MVLPAMIVTAIAGACLAGAFKCKPLGMLILASAAIGLTCWAWSFIDHGHFWPLAAGAVTFIYILAND